MSYDLMVFEPADAPTERATFLDWYEKQTKWSEPHGYNDPSVTSPKLREWYEEMTSEYPDISNADTTHGDLDGRKWTDYSIGKSVIYVAFPWPEAERAYKAVRHLASKHSVGFFDVSGSEGEVIYPNGPATPIKGSWWRYIFQGHA